MLYHSTRAPEIPLESGAPAMARSDAVTKGSEKNQAAPHLLWTNSAEFFRNYRLIILAAKRQQFCTIRMPYVWARLTATESVLGRIQSKEELFCQESQKQLLTCMQPFELNKSQFFSIRDLPLSIICWTLVNNLSTVKYHRYLVDHPNLSKQRVFGIKPGV